jgi:hypothetical protein
MNMTASNTSGTSSALLDPLLEISLTRPERLVEPDAWVGHIPFAFWIVAAHRPRALVELGTHSGNSYGAFCQSVLLLGLDTACYAVDAWKGDPQAGFYGDDVYEDLRRYHDSRYTAFSRLVRSTFDEALSHFPNGFIDLLHIDGCHTYESARHDFDNWAPKLSTRGVVLFHDINVREKDFGAWRLWQEVSSDRPHFAFLHHHGLGVLGVGEDQTPELLSLFASTQQLAPTTTIRKWFAAVGANLQKDLESTRADNANKKWIDLTTKLEDVTRQRDELIPRYNQIAEELAIARRTADELDGLRGEISGLTAANENAERACRLLRADLSKARATLERIPALEHELAKAERARGRAEERLAKMRASPTWKVGWPLRKIAKLFK